MSSPSLCPFQRAKSSGSSLREAVPASSPWSISAGSRFESLPCGLFLGGKLDFGHDEACEPAAVGVDLDEAPIVVDEMTRLLDGGADERPELLELLGGEWKVDLGSAQAAQRLDRELVGIVSRADAHLDRLNTEISLPDRRAAAKQPVGDVLNYELPLNLGHAPVPCPGLWPAGDHDGQGKQCQELAARMPSGCRCRSTERLQ